MQVLSLLLNPRCPRCGRGRLFAGLLTVAQTCESCGLALSEHEKGDGPAFLAIVLVGFIVCGLAVYVEFAYEPPFWLHAALWGPLTMLFSLYFLRLFKALIIHAQWKWRQEDFTP